MTSTDTSNSSLGNNSMIGNVTEDLPTFMDEAQDYVTLKIAYEINKYYLPILVPIGIVGNTLSFLVMIKANNRKVSTCIYMAAISVNDNLMMGMALYSYLPSTFEYPILLCKTGIYVTAILLQNSVLQVLAMTVDKFAAIKWPHKAAIYSTSSRAKFILAGLFIFSLVYNVPHFLTASMVDNRCEPFVFGGVIAKVFNWFSFLVKGIIPILMLIYMNHVIVRTVRSSRKLFESNATRIIVPDANTVMEERQRKMKSAENQLTTMLLLVTTLFLILQIPTYIRYMYIELVRQDTPSKQASSTLFLIITYALLISNNGINFFLYCISGQKFRNDLTEVLCGIGKTCKISTGRSTNNSQREPESDQVFTLSASQNNVDSTIRSDQREVIK